MSEGPLILYTDGAARGNPGPAAVGASLQSPDGEELDSISERIGERTNNEAEYEAVLRGLTRAARLAKDGREVEVRSDSELLIKQMKGEYATRKPELVVLQEAVRAAQGPFRAVTFVWVSREHPGAQRADALANEALNSAGFPKSKRW